MQRKIALIFIIIFVVGVGIFFAFSSSDPALKEVTENPLSKQKGLPTEHSTEETKTDGQEKPESEDVTEQLKTFVEVAVKGTIDYFKNKETHVTAIGDSLTQGVGGKTGDGGYVGILNKAINKNSRLVEFQNYGKRGNRSDQLLKRLDKPEIAASIKQSDIVTITIGANDIMKILKENITDLSYKDFAKERDDYKMRLTKIFDKINDLNPDTEIFLLGFYNPFGKYFPEIKELGIIVKDWNTTGNNVAKEYDNVTFIPTVDLFDDTDVDLFAEDNLHPNTRGYKRIAKRVLEYLTK